MRQIVLDTETTGLEWIQGHRIIEIGCVEIINRRVTVNRYHEYLNPDREIELGAQQVHGISSEFLIEKPRFSEVAKDFLEYVRDAELVIHNAPFDVGFLDSELALLGREWGKTTDYCGIFDTLQLAREIHPGQRNSLDALCKRYDIDNAHRTQHGALLDAELLAEVYLSMTGGQTSFVLSFEEEEVNEKGLVDSGTTAANSGLHVVGVDDEELESHRQTLSRIKSKSGDCLWKT